MLCVLACLLSSGIMWYWAEWCVKSLLWQYRDVEDLMLQHYDAVSLCRIIMYGNYTLQLDNCLILIVMIVIERKLSKHKVDGSYAELLLLSSLLCLVTVWTPHCTCLKVFLNYPDGGAGLYLCFVLLHSGRTCSLVDWWQIDIVWISTLRCNVRYFRWHDVLETMHSYWAPPK